MRRLPTFVLLVALFGGSLVSGQTDEETRKKQELFLKAREQMKVLPLEPAATPTIRPRVPTRTPTPPKPTPTPRPTREPTRTPTAVPRTPTPEPTDPPSEVTPTPQPTPTAKPTPTARPKPTPTPSEDDSSNAPITIQKSSDLKHAELAPKSGGWFGSKWKFLSKGTRKAIDDAKVRKGRWKYIVVHNSGTRQGNAKIFDRYHRQTRHMPNGLAYHFVIGNGSSSGDGEIEIGNRWTRQLNGGHVRSDRLNDIALGICLVGDLNRDKPTEKQLAALDELIRYLRSRCGKVEGRYAIVKGHKEINPVPTDCPGDRFPLTWLRRRFD